MRGLSVIAPITRIDMSGKERFARAQQPRCGPEMARGTAQQASESRAREQARRASERENRFETRGPKRICGGKRARRIQRNREWSAALLQSRLTASARGAHADAHDRRHRVSAHSAFVRARARLCKCERAYRSALGRRSNDGTRLKVGTLRWRAFAGVCGRLRRGRVAGARHAENARQQSARKRTSRAAGGAPLGAL
jgi:hypothetical protein